MRVVNTLILKQLKDMIDRAMGERDEKYVNKNSSIKMPPEFKKLFDKTKEILSKKYICYSPRT